MWPVLIIGVGIMMLMISADVIPDAYGDVLARSWPALLIIFGLNVMLGGRLKYANWGILGLAIILVVVIGNLAYAQREDEYRTDYRESWEQQVSVEQINVEIVAKETQVTLSHSTEPQLMQAFFTGSTESDVKISFDMETSPPTFRVIEERPGILPRLDAVGRGQLNIFLPAGVQVESLAYTGDNGSVTFNLDQLDVRRLDVDVQRGNMDLCLPFLVEGSESRIFGDTVQVGNGDLRTYVPNGISLSMNYGSNPPDIEYRPGTVRDLYDPLLEGLETDGVLNNTFDVEFDVAIGGTLIIDHETPCQQE
jgi:hypothetical protein